MSTMTAVRPMLFSADADYAVESGMRAALSRDEVREWQRTSNEVYPIDTWRRISGGRTTCRMVATF